MVDRITAFVGDLGELRLPGGWNPWGEWNPELDADFACAYRSELLDEFLHARAGVKYALVGLAPGYAGARFSGIPFRDEDDIYHETGLRLSTRHAPWAEATAATVRDTVNALGIAHDVVFWNAYPIHPHNLGEPLSNRTPTSKELDIGGAWLARFLEVVSPGIVVPVGRAAERALNALAESDASVRVSPYVRHPSHGGELAFKRGMFTIVRGSDA